jgi:hypothetical protein
MIYPALARDPKSLARRAALAVFRFLVGNDGPRMRYRPEAHYMREPGPKWREKHGLDRSMKS